MQSPYFNNEHQLFRQSVQAFIQKELQPHFDSWEKERQIPAWAWQKMGEMGFLGLAFEEKYGGSQADIFFTIALLEELGRAGNGGLACAVAVHAFVAMNHISRAGSETLKKKYLTAGIAGQKVGALAISEPDAGSDVKQIKTTATLEGDYWVVNGSKTFISNAYYGDFVTTLCRTANGLSLIVIDLDSKGVSRSKLQKMGWHASDTAELAFDQVKVPKENMVGEEGSGFYYVMDSFQIERLVMAFSAVGAMQGIMDLTLQYIHERKAFGKKIAKFQVLRHQLANLSTEIAACQQLVYHTAWLYQKGEFAVKEATMCKLKATELQKRVVDECLQMFGGYGFMEEYPIAQFYRDSRVGTIAGGTSEIMREIIAKMVIDEVNYDTQY